jgi:hypothetical protein
LSLAIAKKLFTENAFEVALIFITVGNVKPIYISVGEIYFRQLAAPSLR